MPVPATIIFRTWSIADALLAFEGVIRRQDLEEHRLAVTRHAIRWAPHAKPPADKKPPEPLDTLAPTPRRRTR